MLTKVAEVIQGQIIHYENEVKRRQREIEEAKKVLEYIKGLEENV